MTSDRQPSDRLELLLYVGVWVVVLLFPLIGIIQMEFRNMPWGEEQLKHDYGAILPFLILFFINTSILIPYILFKGHVKTYIFQAIILLMVFFVYKYTSVPSIEPHEIHDIEGPHRSATEQVMEPLHGDKFPPPRPTISPIPVPVVSDTIIAALLIGIGVGIKFIFRHYRQERLLSELEKQQIQEKLEYLKAQLSTHFLLNMLNSIHGLVEIDQARAQKLILEMANLLRYVLYESTGKFVPLKSEVEFVRNYVSLMRGRYSSKKVAIDCLLPPDDMLEGKMVPPLVFIVFIENSFKHGISYREESYIRMGFDIHNDRLIFRCINSLNPERNESQSSSEGLGLKTVKKRLTLLFGDNYTLETSQTARLFGATLNIPIYENKVHSS